MSSIHETAYPRFKAEITPRELADVYTPSQEEQAFARRQWRTLRGRLAVLVLVKTAQRLGGLAPYRVEHINQFGDYAMDLERQVPPIQFETIFI